MSRYVSLCISLMNLKDKERLSVDVTDVTIGVFGFELNLQIIHKFV